MASPTHRTLHPALRLAGLTVLMSCGGWAHAADRVVGRSATPTPKPTGSKVVLFDNHAYQSLSEMGENFRDMQLATILVAGGATLFMLLTFLLIWRMFRSERPAKPRKPSKKRKQNEPTIKRRQTAWDSGADRRAAGGMDSDTTTGGGFADSLMTLTGNSTGWHDDPDSINPVTRSRPPVVPLHEALTAGPDTIDPPRPVRSYDTGTTRMYKNVVSDKGDLPEVADDVTQAELLITLGMNEQAIALLSKHIKESDSASPNAWLILFDLYAKTNRRAQYEALAEGFRTVYNASVPSWDEQKAGVNRQLEDYPAVIGKVQRLWGMPTCRGFLESLLVDDRGGARQGFMLAAYRDILFLIGIIDTLQIMAREEEEKRAIEAKIQGR